MRPKFGLVVGLAATIAIFWTIDVFLARMEDREVQIEARHDAEDGSRLLAAGRAADAVDMLRKAHGLEREDSHYSLELAQALMAAGKLNEAEAMLADALEQSPNDGEANLIEARLMVRLGRLDQAQAYYHRAIYGIWPKDAQAQRIRVRLELADLLAADKSNQELVAELILLDAEAQQDLNVRRKVAHLYIEAGSPARAVAAYRALIRDDPDNDPNGGENYAGLGEAQLALGNCREAQMAFQNAIRHGANVQDRLDLATRVAGLDPTPRNLSMAEKFSRSGEILELARDALSKCATGDQAKTLLDDADKSLTAKIRGTLTNEMSEDRLAMAQTIWEFTSSNCASAPKDEALALIMTKLAE